MSTPNRRIQALTPIALAAILAGCLPSSCHRVESHDIAPEDSLSRRIARSLTPDTVKSHLAYTGLGDQVLEWPRTVLLDHEGHVYVGDTKRHSVFAFDIDGELAYELTWPESSFPYLAGWRGDTLVVFTPGELQASLHYVVDTVQVRSFNTPSVQPGTLQYATVTDSSAFVKAVTQADTHTLWQLSHYGVIMASAKLTGSSWDHAGFLRASGYELFSLTGFFPRVTYWKDGLSGSPGELPLRGFDSPMLRRTWAYSQGSARGAPLLTSSAVQMRDYWFVLNLRPGWLRIDVYGSDGELRNILIEQDPSYLKQFYPLDLAVRRLTDDAYDLVVALVADVPVVRRFTWAPQR